MEVREVGVEYGWRRERKDSVKDSVERVEGGRGSPASSLSPHAALKRELISTALASGLDSLVGVLNTCSEQNQFESKHW